MSAVQSGVRRAATSLPSRPVVAPFNHEEWLKWRRSGIGSSDAPAIVGLDPRRGPLAVYLDKTGLLPLEREEDEAMRWGRLLEDAITDEFEVQQGLFVPTRQVPWLGRQPFMRATIDGFVFDSPVAEDETPIALLETKTASRNSTDWEEAVPDYVAVQLQHQLAVTGLAVGFVAALVMWPVPRLLIFQLERDEEAIDVLTEMEADFWQRVARRQPPPADAMPATADALRSAYHDVDAGRTIELTPAAMELVRDRHRAYQEEKAAAERKQTAENGLMAFLGEAETGFLDGRVVVTWSACERRSIDVEALRSEHPKIAERFTKVTTSRRFSFKSLRSIEEVHD